MYLPLAALPPPNHRYSSNSLVGLLNCQVYNGGSGSFFWGTDYNKEWSVMGITSGTVEINGINHEIDPVRSNTWYDRQFGLGLTVNGWNWLPAVLDNGLRITMRMLKPIGKYNKSFASVLYPNGKKEVMSISSVIHEGGEFVSTNTNTTYYTTLSVTFPDTGDYLNPTSPKAQQFKYGEQFSSIPSSRLFEAWATWDGVWQGQQVHGFGLNEQKPAYT